MDYQEILEKTKPEFEKVINYLKGEFVKIRTSRPSASLIESIEIDVFGKKFTLKSLGQISSAGSQDLLIQPWDSSYLGPMEKALLKSPLQISPIMEKDQLRIRFPPLSSQARQNLVIFLSQKTEDAKKTIRHWRSKAWQEIQDNFAEGEISEDNKYRAKDKLQDLVDEYNKKINEMKEKKDKEIME